ncbi:MAG TPA: TolC family protein [Thermoanaerobaculia bacterium]|jgi:outer membrane protein TolC|nr:TolC family protein [Thermoanaerobaculia bacterium]
MASLHFSFAFVLFAAGASALAANAAEPEPALPAPPIEVLIAEALAKNPEIRAAEARAAAARASARPAGTLPGPMFETYLDDESFPRYTVGSSEFSQLGLEFRQELPHPARRRAERAVAASEAEIPGVATVLAIRRVTAGVRTTYARIFALDQGEAAWQAGRELLDLVAATAVSSYGAGQGGQGEVARAQLERLHAEERRIEIAAERRAAEADLGRWLGRSGPVAIGPVAALPPLPPLLESTREEDAELPPSDRPVAPVGHPSFGSGFALSDSTARAVAAAPDVRLRRAALAAAEQRAALAALAGKPDFSAGAGIGTRGGFDPMVALRFGVRFPSWKKARAEALAAAAASEVEAAQAELASAEIDARAQAARLEAEIARSGEIAFHLEQALLPQARFAFDAARSDYLAGRGDLSGALAAFSTWIDARADLARAQAARYSAVTELAALLGPPSESTLLENPTPGGSR